MTKTGYEILKEQLDRLITEHCALQRAMVNLQARIEALETKKPPVGIIRDGKKASD